MKDTILFFLVILVSANQISASCFHGLPPSGPPGHLQPAVCTYKGQTYSPGETWDTDDCAECICYQDGGYSCCGFGLYAGTIGFGDGCELFKIDCLRGIILDKDGIGACDHAGEYIEFERQN